MLLLLFLENGSVLRGSVFEQVFFNYEPAGNGAAEK